MIYSSCVVFLLFKAEDKFLSAVLNDDNSTSVQFRMAPTYVVYMLVRSRVLRLSQPDISPGKQSWLIGSITSKVAHMAHQRIRVRTDFPSDLNSFASLPSYFSIPFPVLSGVVSVFGCAVLHLLKTLQNCTRNLLD